MAQLPEAARHRALLTSNGIDASHLDEGPNRHWQFMYAAWPTAGLQPLLERWASITSALRNSALGKMGKGKLFMGFGEEKASSGAKAVPGGAPAKVGF